jgi:hypothetical protein
MYSGKISEKGERTDMMKMFTVVRIFLERYLSGAKNGRFYRPDFADSILSVWYGLSEGERTLVLNYARRDDLISLENLLRRIDEEDKAKEEKDSEQE